MAQVRNKAIILKDGSALDYDRHHNKNIRKGLILRFRTGGTALMMVYKVEEDKHGFRLWGMNILGEEHSAYAHDCLPITKNDKGTWMSYMPCRRESFFYNEECA